MRILTGHLAPGAGPAWIAGLDVASDRIRAAERLGYLPENGPLYPEMTPLALLRFFGRARALTGARLNANGVSGDRLSFCARDRVCSRTHELNSW